MQTACSFVAFLNNNDGLILYTETPELQEDLKFISYNCYDLGIDVPKELSGLYLWTGTMNIEYDNSGIFTNENIIDVVFEGEWKLVKDFNFQSILRGEELCD